MSELRVVATAAATIVGALAIAACVQLNPRFDPPEVALESLKILRIVDARADMSIGLRVYNPNAYVLSVDRLEFEVAIDGRTAASGRSTHVGDLPARGDASVDIAGRVDVGAVATALMTLGSQLPIDYTMKGSVTLTDGTVLPFARKGRVPITRIDRGFGPRAP
ncbi:MAG: LEA type 2 family protein [Betaproteobacteria bacterium]